MTVHRATLKRKQKAFKSGHRSKGAIKTENKGRIQKDGGGRKDTTLSKAQRKNIASQLRETKKQSAAEQAKIFDGKDGVPKTVAIIPLGSDVDSHKVVEALQRSVDGEQDASSPGTIYIPRFRQKLRFYVPSYKDFFDILDSARAADACLFILSASVEAGDYGEQIVGSISSQGVSTSLAAIYNLSDAGNSKEQSGARHTLTSWFSHFFDFEKLYSLDSANEALTAVRTLCQKAPKGISWRDVRPYLVAENVEAGENGQITVKGYVRGRALSPNQLVHIPGIGDLSILEIGEVVRHGGSSMETDAKVWAPTLERESLDTLEENAVEMNSPDLDHRVDGAGIRIDGHHYVDEMIEADGVEVTPKSITRIPKGMSDYQATWLLEGEDYGFDESEFEGSGEEGDDNEFLVEEEGELVKHLKPSNARKLSNSAGQVMEMSDDEDSREMLDDNAENEVQVDEDMEMELSVDEEARQLREYRQRVRDDLEFPDEMELRPDESAIERFRRYRGLRSLRTAEWDPNEQDERAPAEWPRLGRPGDINATRNRLLKLETAGPSPGTHVLIRLSGTTVEHSKLKQLAEKLAAGVPIVVYGLLAYEHKLSVLNMSILPDSEYTDALPSKKTMLVQCGPRRLLINPLFSQAGSLSSNDVYKYFRFLHPGRPGTATVLAPAILGNVPVTYFTNEETPQLIGTGTVMDADSRRVIVKTSVITGHAVKIHRKLVTVRYMFFSPKDVAWFKAVPLFTNSGRSGYIKESLGTHGYFKATFDGKITAQDVIGMALYKRVWPRKSEPSPW